MVLSSLTAERTLGQTAADSINLQDPGAIVEAFYETFSKSEGEKWIDDQRANKLRFLFSPEANIIITGRSKGVPDNKVFSLKLYIEILRRPSKEAFYQEQVHAVTERFGDIAQVFSTYENRRSPNGKPFARGINSFQLWYDGNRWWIMNIMMHQQRDGKPIPKQYKNEDTRD